MQKLIVLAATAFLATACTPSGAYSSRTLEMPASIDLSQARVDSYGDGSWTELELAGSMDGRLPRVGDFSSAEGYGRLTVDRWDGASYSYVEMNVLTEDGWAMVGINLDQEPGTDLYTWSVGSTVGCAGPSEGDAAFDEMPDDADLTAELVEVDGETYIELTFEGDFRGNDNVVTGVALIPAEAPEAL